MEEALAGLQQVDTDVWIQYDKVHRRRLNGGLTQGAVEWDLVMSCASTDPFNKDYSESLLKHEIQTEVNNSEHWWANTQLLIPPGNTITRRLVRLLAEMRLR